jgi:hypothetical protein
VSRVPEHWERKLDALFAEREAKRLLQPAWWRALKFLGRVLWTLLEA